MMLPSPFFHARFRLTMFPLEQWLIILSHMLLLIIVRNTLISHSLIPSTAQSLSLPSGAIVVRSNSNDSADLRVLRTSWVCLSVSSVLDEVSVSLTRDTAAKEVPDLGACWGTEELGWNERSRKKLRDVR